MRLQLGGSVHDPTDPVGRLAFNDLAMVAEFEADLIKARTQKGMAVARSAGKPAAASPSSRRPGKPDGRPAPHWTEELVRPGGAVRRRALNSVYRALQRAGADIPTSDDSATAPARSG